MVSSYSHKRWSLVSRLDEGSSIALLDAVIDGSITREEIFRDDWRTLSARIRFRGEGVLLKVPRARNGRRWERFLTRFRGSHAIRYFRHMELMAAMGFPAPEPVMACERRDRGVVTDSFICYRYVEGRPAGSKDAPRVLDALRSLHRQGYLRTDAQIANFLVSGDSIVFIDFRLKKPWFLSDLRKARELDRFIRSCPEARAVLTDREASPWRFWIAARLEDFSFGIRRLKRQLRGPRRNEKAR